MRLAGVIFLLIMFLASCHSGVSDEDCKRFKTGTFYYEGDPSIRVIRTNDIQIEYGGYNDVTYSDTCSIIWEGDCNYMLILLGTDRPEDLDFEYGDTLYTEITSASRGYYSFRTVKNGEINEGMLRLTHF